MRVNTFEGGSDGVAITPANSGGASIIPFDLVTGVNNKYSTEQAKFGSLSMKMVNLFDEYVEWIGLGSLTVPLFIRRYLYMVGVPTTTNWNSIELVTTAFASACWPFYFGTDALLYSPVPGNQGSGIGPFSVGQWIRVESSILPHVSAGTIETRLYNNPDADVNSWSFRLQRSGLNTGSDIERVRFGGLAPAATVTAYEDNTAISIDGWIGPHADKLLRRRFMPNRRSRQRASRW